MSSTRRHALTAGVLIAVLAITWSGGGKSGSKYILKYDRRRDSMFKVLDAHHVVIKRKALSETVTDVRYRARYDGRVYNAGSWGMRLEIVYNNWSMEIDDPGLLRQPAFEFLPGKTVFVDLSPLGEVSEMNGFEKLPVIDLGPGAEPIGEVRFKNEIRDLFPGLPGGPVMRGDSWSVTRQFTEPIYGGEADITANYTYTVGEETKKNGRECVQIDGTCILEATGRASRDGVGYDLALKGEGRQTIYFSEDLRMFVRLDEESSLSGNATPKAPGAAGLPAAIEHRRERTVILTF
jgi:hypothetical protein